jgi:hypothetical protein
MNFVQTKNTFIIPILSILGFITNLLSTVVFSLIIKNGQKDNMYKHLLLKSICQALGCFFSCFGPIYYTTGSISYTYIAVFWLNWFQKYIIKALFMASTGYEIAATFNCAISIEKRMKWCEKILSFWLWVVSILVLSFGVEIFPVFAFYIMKFTNINEFNKTTHTYFLWPKELNSKINLFGLAESIIKEVLFLLILLSLNCYILYKLIQIGKRKKRLNTNISNIQNSNRAGNRKIQMIMVLFLTFFFCHLPNFFYFAATNTSLVPTQFWTRFKAYGEIFLCLSYSTSFFVYFAFNNIFRRLILEIIHFRSI